MLLCVMMIATYVFHNIYTGGTFMNKGIFRKAMAAGLALLMLAALAPGMGMACLAPYTVTYSPNAPVNQKSKSENVIVGSYYTIRQNPFTYTGYTFTGWNTQPNGSGNAYTPGQAFTPNANKILYAQWKAVDSVIVDKPT